MANDFLDGLLAGGPDYAVSFTQDGAFLRPTDDCENALKAFQSIVSQVEANEGFGYRIFLTHECSDRPGNRIDRLVIKFLDGGMTYWEEGRIAFQDGKDIHDCPYTAPLSRDGWKAGWQDGEESSRKF